MTENLAYCVAVRISAREGCEPSDLQESLNDVVDPDALESLFNSPKGRVQFPFCGYQVTVNADGHINIE